MMETGLSPYVVLHDLLNSLPDPRVQGRTEYPMVEVVFLSISASLSGAESWEEIADFGDQKLDWLRKYLPFKAGTPSHDTINRVMSLLDSRAFEQVFFEWVSQLFPLPAGASIHLDGKALAGSADKADQQKSRNQGGKYAIQLVHAFCSELGMCLYQYHTGDKKNEPAAVLSILERLTVEGCLVSADANNCRRPIAQYIVDHQANYLLALKGNNNTVHKAVVDAFQAQQTSLSHSVEELDKGHGRVEKRNCQLLPASCLPQEVVHSWPGLATLVRIDASRYLMASGKTEQETRYYISSAEGTASYFNQKVRQHWAVENQLHWVLDVFFAEDASRKRIKNSAQNFALIRKMVLNLLKDHPEKISLRRKQAKCARSDEYREIVLKI